MPRAQLPVDERRHGGELDDGLGDPGPRVGEHLDAQVVELRPAGLRADDDALAAGAVDRLDDHLVEAVEHGGQRLRLVAPVGVDVRQDRVLLEVVAGEVRQVGVDELVVGDAVADGVGQGDAAGPHRRDQPGHPEHGVAAEVHRVEEVVVHPPVDDVDPLLAARRAHPDLAAADDKVTTLDELDTHHPREERVLEVRAVVDAGGEHHDGRVGAALGSSRTERVEQDARVVVDRADPHRREGLGEDVGHGTPVCDDVGDAGRHPDVVLEDAEVALLVADEVDARDMGPDAVGGAQTGRDEPSRSELDQLASQLLKRSFSSAS